MEDLLSYASENATSAVGDLSGSGIVGSHLGYYIAISAVVLAAYAFQPNRRKGVEAPFFKAPLTKWMFSAEPLIRESYEKFRDQVYQIKATEGIRTLIPAHLVGELKGLPEETLSAQAAVQEAMLSDYTMMHLGAHGDTMSALVKSKLTQRLTRLVPAMKDELQLVFRQEFPACGDWSPFKVQPFMVRCVARLSGRAFVGPELSRTEEWLDTSVNFAIHAFIAIIKLQFFPTWSRPVAQYIVSELTTIRKDREKARKMLEPIIEQRLRDADTPGYVAPDDFIQWVLDVLPEEEKRDYQAQAQLQLVLAAASIHTTSNLVTDSIYNLAAYPEIQEELRQEVLEVLEDGNGWERKENMAKLRKMDSFIKESQRLAGNITSFIRKVLKPIDLSDGTHLPAGTNLLTPQAGISHDERFFSDPEEFDPLRFYKLRQKSEEDSNRWQFTSIGDTNMNFGLGKHACPGRFFAGNEVKMILAYMLLNYDLKLKEGEERPKPTMFMMTKSPDPNAEILFRRRTQS